MSLWEMKLKIKIEICPKTTFWQGLSSHPLKLVGEKIITSSSPLFSLVAMFLCK
jgi:hypothetical protein